MLVYVKLLVFWVKQFFAVWSQLKFNCSVSLSNLFNSNQFNDYNQRIAFLINHLFNFGHNKLLIHFNWISYYCLNDTYCSCQNYYNKQKDSPNSMIAQINWFSLNVKPTQTTIDLLSWDQRLIQFEFVKLIDNQLTIY